MDPASCSPDSDSHGVNPVLCDPRVGLEQRNESWSMLAVLMGSTHKHHNIPTACSPTPASTVAPKIGLKTGLMKASFGGNRGRGGGGLAPMKQRAALLFP